MGLYLGTVKSIYSKQTYRFLSSFGPYWICAILERLMPSNLAVNWFLLCPPESVVCRLWEGQGGLRGRESGLPFTEIFYSPISPLFLFLVQIHMLSNDIRCLMTLLDVPIKLISQTWIFVYLDQIQNLPFIALLQNPKRPLSLFNLIIRLDKI